MRKLFVLVLAIGALVLALGVSAGSADAACGTKCLGKQIKKLRGQVSSLQTQVQTLSTQVGTVTAQNACIRQVAVTSYYGYDYLSSFYTTALDFTEPDSSISAWMLAVQPGTCGTATSRTAAAGGAKSGFPPLQPDGLPQRKD